MRFPIRIPRFSAMGCLLLCASAMAQTWNATTALTPSTSSNPNGVRSYGYDPAVQPGYQFKPFNQITVELSNTSPTWRDSAYQSLGTPAIVRNLSGTPLNTVPSGLLILHPGPVPNGDTAILRFAAPLSSSYLVQGQFLNGDIGETEAWIVRNNNFTTPLLSLGITSVNPAINFASLALAAGDTLDFVVGNLGNYNFDSTPLVLTISVVPEPRAGLLLLVGAAALLAWARPRRV